VHPAFFKILPAVSKARAIGFPPFFLSFDPPTGPVLSPCVAPCSPFAQGPLVVICFEVVPLWATFFLTPQPTSYWFLLYFKYIGPSSVTSAFIYFGVIGVYSPPPLRLFAPFLCVASLLSVPPPDFCAPFPSLFGFLCPYPFSSPNPIFL